MARLYEENLTYLEVREDEGGDSTVEIESTPQLPVTDGESTFDLGEQEKVLGSDQILVSVKDAAPEPPEAGHVVEKDYGDGDSKRRSLPDSSTPGQSDSGAQKQKQSDSSTQQQSSAATEQPSGKQSEGEATKSAATAKTSATASKSSGDKTAAAKSDPKAE